MPWLNFIIISKIELGHISDIENYFKKNPLHGIIHMSSNLEALTVKEIFRRAQIHTEI